MAKPATVDRDEKRGSRPEKVVNRAAGQVSNRGGAGPAVQVAGLFARTTDFLRDVRSEMRKVVTPSKEEVRTTTTVVIVTVFAFAAYFYVVDAVLGRTIQSLLRWLGGAQ